MSSRGRSVSFDKQRREERRAAGTGKTGSTKAPPALQQTSSPTPHSCKLDHQLASSPLLSTTYVQHYPKLPKTIPAISPPSLPFCRSLKSRCASAALRSTSAESDGGARGAGVGGIGTPPIGEKRRVARSEVRVAKSWATAARGEQCPRGGEEDLPTASSEPSSSKAFSLSIATSAPPSHARKNDAPPIQHPEHPPLHLPQHPQPPNPEQKPQHPPRLQHRVLQACCSAAPGTDGRGSALRAGWERGEGGGTLVGRGGEWGESGRWSRGGVLREGVGQGGEGSFCLGVGGHKRRKGEGTCCSAPSVALDWPSLLVHASAALPGALTRSSSRLAVPASRAVVP